MCADEVARATREMGNSVAPTHRSGAVLGLGHSGAAGGLLSFALNLHCMG